MANKRDNIDTAQGFADKAEGLAGRYLETEPVTFALLAVFYQLLELTDQVEKNGHAGEAHLHDINENVGVVVDVFTAAESAQPAEGG